MQPDVLRYTKDHEWVGVDGGAAVVGITDYAQKALGDLTFVELPAIGKKVGRHDGLAVVESVKAASDIFAPVGGTVAVVNGNLSSKPEIINKDPYGEGWICRLEPFAKADMDGLMTFGQYQEYVGGL